MDSFTQYSQFFGTTNPTDLIQKYGSPLYVYNETILRQRMKEMANLVAYKHFTANYSIKANSNLAILKMALEEGLNADAMSPGEIYVLLKAGFPAEKIFYVPNNVGIEELEYAMERDIIISLDSISQLELFGKYFPGQRCAVRINPGIGAGHHEKVVTAGKKTKFAISISEIPDVFRVVQKYNLKLVGLNQHIGSLFMDVKPFLAAVETFFSVALQFPELEFVDFGGGFGIPYRKLSGEKPLDLMALKDPLNQLVEKFIQSYGGNITIKSEPGRFIPAEGGVLLGRVHSIKTNEAIKYIGTDLGMNVLMRPTLYDAHHDVEIYRRGQWLDSQIKERVTVVGNICESGDILCQDVELPVIALGDEVVVLDAGAYGFSMASNYNNRLRPAEVLIDALGQDKLIRKRDSFEDLIRNFVD